MFSNDPFTPHHLISNIRPRPSRRLTITMTSHHDDSPSRRLTISTTHHHNDSPLRRLPISTTYHHDDSPFRRLTITTTHHFDDLPSRRITISTTFHFEREVVPVSRHEKEVVPVSRHERETVTTSHYDDFALRRRPSISMTFHHDETFLTRSPRHMPFSWFPSGVIKFVNLFNLSNYAKSLLGLSQLTSKTFQEISSRLIDNIL